MGESYSSLNTVIIYTLAFVITVPSFGLAQIERIDKKGTFEGKGKVVDVQPGRITISDNGKSKSFIIQDSDERAISLDGNDYIVSMPAKINVFGNLPADLLERGMYTRFKSNINRFGKTTQLVKKLYVIVADTNKLGIETLSEPTGDKFVSCEVVGRVIYFRRGKLFLEVPKSRFASQERITFNVDESATFDITSNDLNRVHKGDTVISYKGDKMSNGAQVIRDINIELTAEREKATVSYSDQLHQKFSKYSDEPGKPREVVSKNFVLYTDISERSAKVLLAKLENMHELVFRYYNKRPRQKIVCYVVRDLENFSSLPAVGVSKIQEEAGVTISQGFSLVQGNKIKGSRTESVVYSCADHGVVQHEAVHAYCNMTFGSAGPVWYAEGMAEMGQYWKPDNLDVEIDPVVIEYLTSADKKKMKDIVAAGQITGDSWKAYAWRWALCHLLVNNPNYSRRFKKLGMNMMAKKDDSFTKAFGAVADQISLEYDEFVKNFDNGYRADLCVWDWSVPAKRLTNSKPINLMVKAQGGWHATPVEVVKGEKYDVITKGKWKLEKNGEEIDADGDPNGRGKLMGVILKKYKLTDPFELGSQMSFTASQSGQLYLRCADKWNSIADNSQEIKVYIRKSPK